VIRQAAQSKSKPQYDTSAPRINPGEAAFTRRRELFVGRLAMLGFLAATLGELATGRGPLGQLRLETLLPQPAIDAILLGIVLYSGFSALRPGSFTFSDENQADVNKRPKGPTNDPTIYPGDGPQKYLGISKVFGFTKKNEVFVGRMAMIGFAAACIGEKLTNKGPLGQIGIPFGLPLNTTYAGIGLGAWVLFFLFAAIGNQKFGPEDDRTDIY
jgi:photosystem II protein